MGGATTADDSRLPFGGRRIEVLQIRIAMENEVDHQHVRVQVVDDDKRRVR